MKAAPFDYLRARDLAHVLDLLDQHGDAARLLAGGQSLVPMMAMRLVRPSLLVDICRLTELHELQQRDDRVIVGATMRQSELLASAEILSSLPLLADALPWVGHLATRNRGTIGGSLAHADPSAELPLALLVLDGCVLAQSHARGLRRISAEDFFVDALSTSLADDECLVGSEWPVHDGPRSGTAFDETAIRKGDFALASAACQLSLAEDGSVVSLRIGVGGVGGTPRAFPTLAAQLIGQSLSGDNIRALASELAASLDAHSDVHADAAFRRHLAQVLSERVIVEAARRAQTD